MYRRLWHLITFIVILSFYHMQSYADVPKPDHFGVFLVDGEKLIELKAQNVDQKNLVGYMTMGLIGVREVKESPVVSESAYFIIYGQPQLISEWKVTRLKYVERYQDVMIRKDPFKVGMWLPDSAIPFTTSIIENLPNAFVFKPSALLVKGGYVLHFHSLEPLTYAGRTDAYVYPIAVGGALKKTVKRVSIKGIPIYAIHFSFRNPKLYFLGSTGCIYHKIDDGYVKTPVWQIKDNISLLTVNPNNTQELFVSFASVEKKKFLLFSNDGGTTWEKAKLMGLKIQDSYGWSSYILRFNAIKFDVVNPNIIAIAGAGNFGAGHEIKGIFMTSLDGGKSWSNIKIQDKIVFDVVSNGSTVFFSTDKAMYRFLVKKKKTEKIVDSPAEVRYLQVSPLAKGRILGATLDGKIYISENNGESFTLLANTKENIQDFAVDPKLVTTLWFATQEGLYKMKDKGVTKIEIKGLSRGKIFCLAINPENGNEVFVGTSQGLFITKDGGVNWVKKK